MQETEEDKGHYIPKDYNQSFANYLRFVRQARGWTQAKMAEILGVKQPYYNQIENKKRNVSEAKMRQFAKRMGGTLRIYIEF
jgi:transcriptional regulator with XRE-family HTH domain